MQGDALAFPVTVKDRQTGGDRWRFELRLREPVDVDEKQSRFFVRVGRHRTVKLPDGPLRPAEAPSQAMKEGFDGGEHVAVGFPPDRTGGGICVSPRFPKSADLRRVPGIS